MFKAHIFSYHSTLGLKVIEMKKTSRSIHPWHLPAASLPVGPPHAARARRPSASHTHAHTSPLTQTHARTSGDSLSLTHTHTHSVCVKVEEEHAARLAEHEALEAERARADGNQVHFLFFITVQPRVE